MLYSRKVKSCDKSTGFPPIKTALQIIHSWFQLLWTQHKAVIKRRGLLTEGNGSSSSLVKELKGYDEEGIRCAQHRFKRQELLEWDQPVIEGVFLVEEETKKKALLKMYFYSILTELLPLVQTKLAGFFPQTVNSNVLWSHRRDLTP